MLKVDIKKRLNKFTLEVAFNVSTEILAILGPSGCGKSMTLKCIAGVETPDEGYIELGGRVLFDSAKKVNLPPQQRGWLFISKLCPLSQYDGGTNIAAIKGDRKTKKNYI